jgi:hypothetical protein
MARPTKYSEEILVKTQAYIDACNDIFETIDGHTMKEVNIPTIEGLAYELKLNKDTIYSWRKEHEEFSELIGQLLAKQAKSLVNKGLSGEYNPTIAKVLLTKHGYREGIDSDITTQGEKISVGIADTVLGKADEMLKESKLNANPS